MSVSDFLFLFNFSLKGANEEFYMDRERAPANAVFMDILNNAENINLGPIGG